MSEAYWHLAAFVAWKTAALVGFFHDGDHYAIGYSIFASLYLLMFLDCAMEHWTRGERMRDEPL